MEGLIISYAIKASLAMILLYGLYALCFRNDTFNKAKRFYLLFIVVFSLLYPFCKLSISTSADIPMYQAILPQIEVTDNTTVDHKPLLDIGLVELLLITYICGILIMLSRFLIQLSGVLNLILRNGYQNSDNYKIISLNMDITPFSFFRWIFIPYNSFKKEDLSLMLEHEKEHADQYHSLDILLSELFYILFWWNPVTWLLKREIKINLEYLADKGVLEKGVEAKKYQYLLLQVIKPSATIQIVNNFNVSQLKKRITMINKKRTSRLMSCKYLLAFPIVALMLLGNAQKTFSRQIENVVEEHIGAETTPSVNTDMSRQKENVYTSVQVMPQYPGGDEALMKYINANIKYPEQAVKDKVEGNVVIRLVVSKTGEVKDVTVLRSLDARCDIEAVRVVKAMPTWTPGKQNGKDVDVYYVLPIKFVLPK
ncbi:TonB family protein [Dysgonomonas alginatilytica]|uniref:TonB family protein n=1 Tax=Dysgonomonas alginatilytica TaxID=1605892 RepID=A0A2V3PPT6_9BACT|nr:M56 family metallopeptidase [Dysgonomonas alginatilytica]PXV64701.1 TonB family protein [Dysgonomonas alginatilytica]